MCKNVKQNVLFERSEFTFCSFCMYKSRPETKSEDESPKQSRDARLVRPWPSHRFNSRPFSLSVNNTSTSSGTELKTSNKRQMTNDSLSIFYIGKVQGMGGGRGAGLAAVFAFDDALKVIDRYFFGAHLQ